MNGSLSFYFVPQGKKINKTFHSLGANQHVYMSACHAMGGIHSDCHTALPFSLDSFSPSVGLSLSLLLSLPLCHSLVRDRNVFLFPCCGTGEKEKKTATNERRYQAMGASLGLGQVLVGLNCGCSYPSI